MSRGALLHDVGKIGVSDGILLKPGKLTDDESGLIRKHPENGYNMLHQVTFLKGAAEIILAHHERWDGKGYPKGLEREEVPLGARIFMVCDTFDSMTSDRPYRKALTAVAAMDEILKYSGSQFDPQWWRRSSTSTNAGWPNVKIARRGFRPAASGICSSTSQKWGVSNKERPYWEASYHGGKCLTRHSVAPLERSKTRSPCKSCKFSRPNPAVPIIGRSHTLVNGRTALLARRFGLWYIRQRSRLQFFRFRF